AKPFGEPLEPLLVVAEDERTRPGHFRRLQHRQSGEYNPLGFVYFERVFSGHCLADQQRTGRCERSHIGESVSGIAEVRPMDDVELVVLPSAAKRAERCETDDVAARLPQDGERDHTGWMAHDDVSLMREAGGSRLAPPASRVGNVGASAA